MIRCLRDGTLLLLYEGEGTSTQRSHLAECEACAIRYRHLGRDLEVIGRVLREESPSKTLSHCPPSLTFRLLPTAAVLIIALMLVWGGARMWSISSPSLDETRNEDIRQFMEEASTALFFPQDAIAEEPWPQVADFHDLSVALGEEWPCVDLPAWSEAGFSDEAGRDFDGYAFPLLCGW